MANDNPTSIHDKPTTVPPIPEMVRKHTFATEIITRYGTDDDIFDSDELERLHRFVANPADRLQILRDIDMVDHAGAEPGMRAHGTYGSLAGFIIARHGSEHACLTDEEIERLRVWFGEEKRY